LYIDGRKITAFGISAYPGDAGIVIVPGLVGGALLGALVGWITM
jgi:hypothetical protein